MYVPKLFENKDTESILEFIQKNPFGILVTQGVENIVATHIPLLLCKLENGNYVLRGHIGRANNQHLNWQKSGETDVLTIFTGAHAYISSSWYEQPNVSTWNYEEVQIYGIVEIMSDNELYNHLKKLTNFFELPQKCPMTLERMGNEFVEKEMRGALGIKIIPTDVKIKQKLSQNRDEINYQRIIENLNESHFPMDKIIAKKMTDLKR